MLIVKPSPGQLLGQVIMDLAYRGITSNPLEQANLTNIVAIHDSFKSGGIQLTVAELLALRQLQGPGPRHIPVESVIQSLEAKGLVNGYNVTAIARESNYQAEYHPIGKDVGIRLY